MQYHVTNGKIGHKTTEMADVNISVELTQNDIFIRQQAYDFYVSVFGFCLGLLPTIGWGIKCLGGVSARGSVGKHYANHLDHSERLYIREYFD